MLFHTLLFCVFWFFTHIYLLIFIFLTFDVQQVYIHTYVFLLHLLNALNISLIISMKYFLILFFPSLYMIFSWQNFHSKTRWTIETYCNYNYQPYIIPIIAWNKWRRFGKHLLRPFHSVTRNRISKNQLLSTHRSSKRKRKCKSQ